MRAADMADIGFGPERVIETGLGPHQVNEFILHIRCAWRVVAEGRILVGSSDLYFPPLSSDIAADDFDAGTAKRTLRDDLVDALLAHREGPHIVAKVVGSSTGDLRLEFDDGCALETFASSAQRPDARDEHWRFFQSDSESHFVVAAEGIDE